MADRASRISTASKPKGADRTVMYRGIRIDPIAGKRSPVAQALRDALRLKSKQSDGRPASA